MTRTPPHLATLVVMTALTVLTLNMFLPALPTMQADFGVSKATMGLAISGYMLCAAFFQLLLGPLSDRIGRRPVMLGALGIYVVASVICLVTSRIDVFLVARAAQAVAVAGGVISSAVVRDLYEGRAAAAKLGVIAAAMSIAPMLAPVLGGVLDVTLGWRAIFASYSVLGLALLALVWVDLGETRQPRTGPGLLARIGVLLRAPLYWAYVVCIGFGVGAFYIFLVGAPFVAAQVYGLGSGMIGVGLGSITGGFMLGALVSSRSVARIGTMPLILLGRVLPLGALLLALGFFALGQGGIWLLFGATICVGIGNGLSIPNANAGALSVVPEVAGTAAGVTGAVMLLIGALLSTLTTALLAEAPTPERLLIIMVTAVAVSLGAALVARRLDVTCA